MVRRLLDQELRPRPVVPPEYGALKELGLLIVEALLCCSATPTRNLGTVVLVDQVVAAAERSAVSTIALSFSSACPRGHIAVHLGELARRPPEDLNVWIGGADVNRLRRLSPSVT